MEPTVADPVPALDDALPPGTTGTGRVEAFSDGVMAIAITLLVLEIRVPEHDASGRDLGHDLLHLWPSYLAYLASFVTIGIIWLNHHAFMARVRGVSRGLQWWNLLLLLSVSFLPFPTNVLAEYVRDGDPSDARAAVALYGAVGVLMTLPWVGMWRCLVRQPRLLRPGVDLRVVRAESWRPWVGVLIYAACIGIGLLSPITALALFVANAVFFAVTSSGWTPEASAAPPPGAAG